MLAHGRADCWFKQWIAAIAPGFGQPLSVSPHCIKRRNVGEDTLGVWAGMTHTFSPLICKVAAATVAVEAECPFLSQLFGASIESANSHSR